MQFWSDFDKLRGLECKKRSTRKKLLFRGLFEGINAVFLLKKPQILPETLEN